MEQWGQYRLRIPRHQENYHPCRNQHQTMKVSLAGHQYKYRIKRGLTPFTALNGLESKPAHDTRITWPTYKLIKTLTIQAGKPRCNTIDDIAYSNELGIVSYCAIVTLPLRRAVFTIFDFKKCRDLDIGVRGHSRSRKVAPCDRAPMTYIDAL